MTLQEEVMSYESIFSLMYSPILVSFRTLEDQIIEIKVSELEWFENKEGFYYIWGWPGPDYNRYTRDTYGKGWAYTKEEIIEAWRKQNEI